MNAQEFFKIVLPPTAGTYYLVTKTKDNPKTKKRGAVIHHAFNSLEELAIGVERFKDDHTKDVYHACSSFKEEFYLENGSRKYRVAPNWSESKALRVDLDCGQEKFDKGDGYLDKGSAIADIDRFCTENDFPLPMLLDSGNGIHGYWPFTKSMPADKWVLVASVFKDVLTHHGVKADPSVTSDFSRILRPPGSFNNKGDPKPVIVIREVPLLRASEVAKRIKELVTEAKIKPEPVRSYTKSINEDLMVTVMEVPSYGDEVAKHCNQIKQVAVSRGNVSRPIWFAAMGLSTFCEEGIDIAAKWTEKRGETGHTDTDYESAFNSWGANPPVCSRFESDNAKGCVGCLHKGKINTPLVLGRARRAMQETIKAEQSSEIDESPPLLLPDKNGNGRPISTTANVQAVLNYEGVTARYNQMTKGLEIIVPGVSSVPDESSNSNQTAALDLLTRHGVPYARAPEQINAIAASNPYCPVRQMIERKPWDGISRFKSVMAQIKTPHPEEAAFYSRKWLIQCVAAAYLSTGLSAAGILVLAGLQGIGKTWFIRWLASAVPDSFLEGATLDPSNKDSVMTIASHWIVELGELDATFRKADLAQLKAFITKSLDKFRRPYAKKDSEFPRRTVMAGTVNDAEFLYDTTGNRRFWVIQVDAIQIDQSIDIQQLWAEVKTWYDAGEIWHFNQHEQLLLNQHNSQFEVVDPISEKIQMKFNFQEMDKTTWLTATRIAEIALYDHPTKGEVQRVSTVVRSLNGGQAKRVKGIRLLCVPGVHV